MRLEFVNIVVRHTVSPSVNVDYMCRHQFELNTLYVCNMEVSTHVQADVREEEIPSYLLYTIKVKKLSGYTLQWYVQAITSSKILYNS